PRPRHAAPGSPTISDRLQSPSGLALGRLLGDSPLTVRRFSRTSPQARFSGRSTGIADADLPGIVLRADPREIVRTDDPAPGPHSQGPHGKQVPAFGAGEPSNARTRSPHRGVRRDDRPAPGRTPRGATGLTQE